MIGVVAWVNTDWLIRYRIACKKMNLDKTDFLLWFLICSGLLLHVLATRKILLSKRIITRVKIINVMLIWLIPFIWALLVLSYSDKPPTKTGKFDSGRYMDTGYPGA